VIAKEAKERDSERGRTGIAKEAGEGCKRYMIERDANDT